MAKWASKFTGKELLEQLTASNLVKHLPKKGQKDFAPDGSQEDLVKLRDFHESYNSVLQQQRVKTETNLAQAEWLQEEGLFKLLTIKGKFWKNLGFSKNSENFLSPEEGLYLLDEGALEAKFCGVPLSVQEAYSVILGCYVTPGAYQVYSHLSRLGFVLHRFQNVSSRTTYERQLKVTKLKRNKKRKPGIANTELHPTCKIPKTLEEIPETLSVTGQGDGRLEDNADTSSSSMQTDVQQLAADESMEHSYITAAANSPNSKKTVDFIKINDDQETDDVIVSNDDIIKTENSHMETSSSDYCKWDFTNISFPDCRTASTQEKLTITFLDRDKLPQNMRPAQSSYTYEPDQLFTVKHRAQENEPLEFSYNKSERLKIKAGNWVEYHKELDKFLRDVDNPSCSPAACLWSGNVKPVVRPSDAVSFGAVRRKLQIFKTVESLLSEDKCEDSHAGFKATSWEITFDAYLPTTKFKKSSDVRPDFRVATSRDCHGPPNFWALKRLNAESERDGVQLYWALVDGGDVAFYAFDLVTLPELNS